MSGRAVLDGHTLGGRTFTIASSGKMRSNWGMTARSVNRRYDDPLDLIWIRALDELGWQLRRSDEAYASWDGSGQLTIATRQHLDADDSLAQLVFHEICHALVAGPEGMRSVDWALSNCDDRDVASERATHRVQATLAAAHGLREFFAVTTDHRADWDSLPQNPMWAPRSLPEPPDLALAQKALARAARPPFAEVLERALSRTAAIAEVVRELAPPESLWSDTRGRHATGLPLGAKPGRTCGGCAWAAGATGEQRCLQTATSDDPGREVAGNAAACERWEPRIDERTCGACGACCREGFDLVLVGVDEPVSQAHPDWIQESSLGYQIPRPGGRCPALQGDGAPSTPFRCVDYAGRPRSCCEFEVAGQACLLARRRVGLSR